MAGLTGDRRKIVALTEEAMVYSDVFCIDCGGKGYCSSPGSAICPRCDGVGKERRKNLPGTRLEEADQFGRMLARQYTKELRRITNGDLFQQEATGADSED